MKHYLSGDQPAADSLLAAFYLTQNPDYLLQSWLTSPTHETALSVAVYLKEPYRTQAVDLLLADPRYRGFGHLISIGKALEEGKSYREAAAHLKQAADHGLDVALDFDPSYNIRQTLIKAGMDAARAREACVKHAAYCSSVAFTASMVGVRQLFDLPTPPDHDAFAVAESATKLANSARAAYPDMFIVHATANGLEDMALRRLDPGDLYNAEGLTVGERIRHLRAENARHDRMATSLLNLDFEAMSPETRSGFLDRYDRMGETRALAWLESNAGQK